MDALSIDTDTPAAEWRRVLGIALPLIAGNVAQVLLTTTDIFLIARIGTHALASAALAASFYQAVSVFCGGLVMATMPLIAAATGRGDDPSELRAVIAGGLATVVLAGVPAWLLFGQTPAILLWLGQTPAIAQGAGEMMETLRWAILPYLTYILMRGTLAATGHARWTILVVLAAALFNALAGWALILGNLGLPALGLRGAGIVTTMSSLVMALGGAIIVARHPKLAPLRLFAGWQRVEARRLKALWRLGLPMAVLMGCEMGIFYAAMLMAGAVGPDTLAAHSVAMQIATVSFMLPFGMGQAATVRTGHAFGAGDAGLAARAARSAGLMGLGFAMATGLATILFPRAFLGIFLGPESPVAVTETGTVMLRIAAFFLLGSAIQTIATGALRGLQDTRWPMVIACIGYWGVGIPAALLLGFALRMGGPGIWLGLTFGIVSVAAVMTWRWRRHLAAFRTYSA
jgi:multidrug resistance protein, MATE family